MRCHFKICTISFIINGGHQVVVGAPGQMGVVGVRGNDLGLQLNGHHGLLAQHVDLMQVQANLLYDRLGPSMSVRMNDGSFRRIRTNELKDAADDVMGVLFDQLKVYSVNYQALQSYVMESGSFSAMRVLYVRYAGLMTDGERRVLARVIRDARPASDWKEWLSDSSESPGGVL